MKYALFFIAALMITGTMAIAAENDYDGKIELTGAIVTDDSRCPHFFDHNKRHAWICVWDGVVHVSRESCLWHCRGD